MSKNLIEKLEREVKRLKELAFKDELTQLYNRRGFKEESLKFLNEVLASKRYKKRKSLFINNFSLIVFDIDNFKKLNDNYGHDAGDAAIKQLGNVIRDRVRSIDSVARWGGEEFIVGLVGASEKDAYVIADDIRERIEAAKLDWRGRKISTTLSGGVADLSKAKDFEDLFHSADKALYSAKRTGKNKIVKASELKRK